VVFGAATIVVVAGSGAKRRGRARVRIVVVTSLGTRSLHFVLISVFHLFFIVGDCF
jgi:hypothetical protein